MMNEKKDDPRGELTPRDRAESVRTDEAAADRQAEAALSETEATHRQSEASGGRTGEPTGGGRPIARNRKVWRGVTALLAAAAVVTATILTASLPHRLEEKSRELRTADDWSRALRTVGRLVAIFPRSDEARRSVLGAASDLSLDRPRVLVGSDFSLVAGGRRPTNAEEYADQVMQLMDRVAERQRNEMWTFNIGEDKAEMLAALGRFDEARVVMGMAIAGFERLGAPSRALDAEITMLEWSTDSEATIGEARRLLAYAESAGDVSSNGQSDTEARAEHLASVLPHPFQRARLHLIIAEAAVALERYDEARVAYERAIEAETDNIALATRHEGETDGSRPRAVLAEQPIHVAATFGLALLDFVAESGSDAMGEVWGTITAGGRPLAGSRVYLTPATESEGTVMSTQALEQRSFSAEVDESGRFRSVPLPPGEYRVAVGLDDPALATLGRADIPSRVTVPEASQVELNIRFSQRITITEPTGRTTIPAGEAVDLPIRWQAHPDAHSYAVELQVFVRDDSGRITGWSATPLKRRLAETSYRLHMSGLDLWQPAPAMSDARGAYPVGVLGPWYPGNPTGVRVLGYDPAGAIVSDSEGYVFSPQANYPIVTLSDDWTARFAEFADAARATADRDYQRARELWEAALRQLDSGSRRGAAAGAPATSGAPAGASASPAVDAPAPSEAPDGSEPDESAPAGAPQGGAATSPPSAQSAGSAQDGAAPAGGSADATIARRVAAHLALARLYSRVQPTDPERAAEHYRMVLQAAQETPGVVPQAIVDEAGRFAE